MKNIVTPTLFRPPPLNSKLVTYYLTCFDKRVQEMNLSGQAQTVQMGGM